DPTAHQGPLLPGPTGAGAADEIPDGNVGQTHPDQHDVEAEHPEHVDRSTPGVGSREADAFNASGLVRLLDANAQHGDLVILILEHDTPREKEFFDRARRLRFASASGSTR